VPETEPIIKHRADFGTIIAVVVALFAFAWTLPIFVQPGNVGGLRWDVLVFVVVVAVISTDAAILFAASQYDETRRLAQVSPPVVGGRPRFMARPGAYLRRVMERSSTGPGGSNTSHWGGMAFNATVLAFLLISWSPVIFLLI
jgi:hypothetical protein